MHDYLEAEVVDGCAVAEAEVLELNRDYSLLVRYEDGLTACLNTGEVSVHP